MADAQVVLLRAVNVGAKGTLPMEEFRQVLAAAGCREVRTVGVAGSAVLTSTSRVGEVLEEELRRRLTVETGVVTELFVRGGAEWLRLERANPFPLEAAEDPSHTVLTVLSAAPTPQAWERLRARSHGPERIAAGERCAYLVYPNGIGRSPLTAAFLERQLEVRGTSRNWNTVKRLRELSVDPD